jgi:phenylalanyl-tRNA synthetase beta chain
LQEQQRIAIAITGERFPLFWMGDNRKATRDIYDLKGMLEEFLEQFGVRGTAIIPRSDSSSLFLEAAALRLGKLELGTLGQLQPGIARHYDLRDAVFLAELNLDLLLARRNSDKGFRPLPLFPSIRRDVAMLLPEQTTHDAVIAAAKKGNVPNLEKVELFDVFRGSNIPAGQKSVAYAFTYRSPERTLTDAEVNAAHERVVAHLKTTLQATIRDQGSTTISP